MKHTLARLAKYSAVSLAVLAGIVLLGLSVPFAGNRALSVQTGSMEPAIRPGSLVFVNRVPVSDIADGDVITYTNPANPTQTITHRVVQTLGSDDGPKYFVTKGDANRSVDELVPEHRVIGRVNTVVPYLGRLADMLHTWPGIIVLVYVPALIIVSHEVRRLSAYYRSLRYVLPEFLERRTATAAPAWRGLYVLLTLTAALAAVFVAVPIQAAPRDLASLTSNTIQMTQAARPQPQPKSPVQDGDAPTSARHQLPREQPKSSKRTAPNELAGGVEIQRVFMTCSHEADEHTEASIVLYNSSRQAINAGMWMLRLGNEILLTLPYDTVVPAEDVQVLAAILPPGSIASAPGILSLHNQDNEQISKIDWDPLAYGNSECLS